MNASQDRIKEISATIDKALGADGTGRVDGVYAFYHVKEMYERAGSSVWKTKPSGRFQINVATTSGRDKIFRTKKSDGSFNLEGVVEAISERLEHFKASQRRQDTREANRNLAEELCEKFRTSKFYVSHYGNVNAVSSQCSPSQNKEGHLNVVINFGDVDAETAEKILALAASLRG